MAGAGIDLLLCLATPEELVHHVKANGEIVACPVGEKCSMTELHMLHVAIAGLVTTSSAIITIVREYRRNSVKHES